MKKAILSLSLIAVGLIHHSALAQEKVNQTLDADTNGYVHIEHMNGKAEIIGWDKAEVKVVGELGERTEEFIFERKGDEIRIEVEVKKKSWGGWNDWSSDEGVDLTIYVPHASAVNYESINARVSAEKLYGNTQIEVVNGQIDADNLTGRVRLESVNGGVDLRDIEADLDVQTVNGEIRGDHKGQGDLSIESVNGSIRLSSDSQEIRAESVNGDIELTLAMVKEIEMTTVNGDIEVSMTLHDSGEVEASTVGGKIDMVFQKGVSARFDIEGHAGGKIVNRITDDKMQKAKYGPRRWLNFTTGNGSAQVELSTVNGRVEIDSK